MTKKIIKKNIRLSLEFDTYLNKHPDLYEQIPNGASIVITVKGDQDFNQSSTEHTSNVHGEIIEARKEGRIWTLNQFVPA